MIDILHFETTYTDKMAVITFDRDLGTGSADGEATLRLAPAYAMARIDGVGDAVVLRGLAENEFKALVDGRVVCVIEHDPATGKKTAYQIDRVAVLDA